MLSLSPLVLTRLLLLLMLRLELTLIRVNAAGGAAQMDVAFTLIFAVELLINIFAHWFWPFVSSGWWAIPFYNDYKFIIIIIIL